MSTFITIPVVITDDLLDLANVPEDTDQAAYDAGTTYGLGDYCFLASTHRIYRSTAGSNTANNPDGDDGSWWVVDSWTPPWRALSQNSANPTVAETSDGIEYRISPGIACDVVGLFGVKAKSVRVVVKNLASTTIYQKTKTAVQAVDGLDWHVGNMVFPDLPISEGYQVRIFIYEPESGDRAELGQVVVGHTYEIGTTEEGGRIGFEDLSIKEQDAAGAFSIVERGVSDMVTFMVSHPTNETRWIKSLLINSRATPCMFWAGEDQIAAGMFAFGYAEEPVTDYDVTLSNTEIEVVGIAYTNTGVIAE